MKFLFDQNISHLILKFIPKEYSDSTTVKNEGLINATDREIWEFAKINEYIIVSQDSDFNERIFFRYKSLVSIRLAVR